MMRFLDVLEGRKLLSAGVPDFNKIQLWDTQRQGHLVYYVFDLLWLDGYDLTILPLIERKKILRQIIPENNVIRYSDHVERNGKAFFEIAKKYNKNTNDVHCRTYWSLHYSWLD